MRDDELDSLARAYGIAPRYRDAAGRERVVSVATKRALLAAMGVALCGSAADALRRARIAHWSTPLEPATVASVERPAEVLLRAPAGARNVGWTLLLETGEARRGESDWSALRLIETERVDGTPYEARMLTLPDGLPEGYHRLSVDGSAVTAEAALIVAPPRCSAGPNEGKRRPWALAVQLYGLCSAASWGVGDYGDLARFAETAAGLGADAVAVSPIHALFPADPGHFGPYGPSSRRFLNAGHIDVAAVPGFTESEAVRRRFEAEDVQRALATARAAELVDYPAVAAARRPVLEAAWKWFRAAHRDNAASPLGTEFARFKTEQGEALDQHATFEALHAHIFGADHGRWHWTTWPEPLRDAAGPAVAAFAREHAERVDFYRWLQWLADRQLGAAQAQALAAGMAIGLYRDLAVGTDSGGSSAWARPDTVLTGATIGAPADAFNQRGQDWGLAALSPEGLRRNAFAPFVETLRANMRHAGALRIDHVMGLERLFWIPAGAEPMDGAYVAYPGTALRRLLALESCRNACLVVGEDLGTVPAGFRARQEEAGILGYKVFYFERDAENGFVDPQGFPEPCVVTATTHDLPPLAGWWAGRDIDWRRRIGLFIDTDAAEAEAAQRAEDRRALLVLLARLGLLPEGAEPDIAAVIEAVYAALARAPARLLVVAAEDLVGAAEQPNLPGTYDEHPNWRRRLPCLVDDIAKRELAARVAGAVRRGRG